MLGARPAKAEVVKTQNASPGGGQEEHRNSVAHLH